jgi:hypothetical protein
MNEGGRKLHKSAEIPHGFYLWGNLTSEVYSNNPHMLDDLSTTPVKELDLLRSVNSN